MFSFQFSVLSSDGWATTLLSIDERRGVWFAESCRGVEQSRPEFMRVRAEQLADMNIERAIGFEPTTSSLGNDQYKPALGSENHYVSRHFNTTDSLCKVRRSLARTCENSRKFRTP